jgi:hypothetical protein
VTCRRPCDDWTYLRFLLPAFPALLALVAPTLAALLARLPDRSRGAALLAVVVVLAVMGVAQARARHVFGWAFDERRYVSVGRFVETHLPPAAVLLAMQHSGSARHYSGRLTVRYDQVDPIRLDALLTALSERGFHPFFLLDAWEEERFRARFGGRSMWGALDWEPLAETATPTVVRIYDPRNRGVAGLQRSMIP